MFQFSKSSTCAVVCSNPNIFFSVRNYCVYFRCCCSWRRWPPSCIRLLCSGRVKINPDHLPGDETKGNICCLPVVLSLQEVELLLDAINRLADCQLERGRLWTLKKKEPCFRKPCYFLPSRSLKTASRSQIDSSSIRYCASSILNQQTWKWMLTLNSTICVSHPFPRYSCPSRRMGKLRVQIWRK